MLSARLTLLAALFGGCAERALEIPLVDSSSPTPSDDAGADLAFPDLREPADLSPPADLAQPLPPPSRLLAPLSTATVTTHRPSLRWQPPATAAPQRVELCRDRACSQILATATVDATGARATPDSALAPGVVFWRVLSLDGRVSSATWEFWVTARDTAVDSSSGSTLDVNGDGYPDLITGEPFHGAGHLYMGGPAGLGSSAPVDIPVVQQGPADYERWAPTTGVSAGDLNGDGYGDLAVTVESVTATTQERLARIYLGGPSGISSAATTGIIDLAPPTGAELWPGAWTVACAGDVDGDGYGDLMVTYVEGQKAVRLILYFGGPSGVARQEEIPVPGLSDLNDNTAQTGDFNGDGYGDLLAGANDAAGNSGLGVYLGGPSGLSAPTVLAAPAGATLYTFSPAVGDFNGDGLSDAAVLADGPPSVLVFLGSSTGISSPATVLRPVPTNRFTMAAVGDLDGDGQDDLLLGVDSDVANASAFLQLGVSSTVIELKSNLIGFGWSRAGVGDVDGDGRNDLAVGAPFAGNGAILIYSGASGGLRTTELTQALRLDPPAGAQTFGYFINGPF